MIAPPAHAAEAASAPEPSSLLALFQRLPDLPANAPEAARWFDARGQLIHPGMLALQADIRARQQALAPLAAALGERGRAQGQRTVAALEPFDPALAHGARSARRVGRTAAQPRSRPRPWPSC
ncbi:hypothetical protein [Roseateles sp.]|uniref:hypothetical protein n=1 Tax=Roseateles sp. TaxID=1971397 RepID=UPI00326505F7